MSLPALAALARACPDARIEVLARPWVAELYAMQPGVGRVLIIDEKGQNKGLGGMMRLVKNLRAPNYQWAILLQNAFKAAALAWLARIPTRIGYSRDGRGFLLTQAVPCPASIRKVHETAYYLNILHQVGLCPAPNPNGTTPELHLSAGALAWANEFLQRQNLSGPLLGLAPGASFGPAKCWPAQNYAAAARELAQKRQMTVLIFGSAAEDAVARQVMEGLGNIKAINLCGALGLAQALALLSKLNLLLTNDSGLMHAAAALGAPTLAIFGSTNPQTTRPLGPKVTLLRKPLDCSPCLKPACPHGHMRCFWAITPEEVVRAASALLNNDEVR